MTYFGFLSNFLLPPLILLGVLTWQDVRRGRTLPLALRGQPAWLVLLAHILVAVLYTTPWDNYLVATGVWYYDPALVTGIVLGWVPLEEYTFFVLQTLLTGLWLLYLARRLPISQQPLRHQPWSRWLPVLLLSPWWLACLLILWLGWQPGTYLALILIWALPPVMFQLGFGADILWRRRRLVLASLLPVLIYLSLADALAIQAGTWTIDPDQSLQIYLAGVLPLEEFIFFLITNGLIVFGMILVLARESQERARFRLSQPADHLL